MVTIGTTAAAPIGVGRRARVLTTSDAGRRLSTIIESGVRLISPTTNVRLGIAATVTTGDGVNAGGVMAIDTSGIVVFATTDSRAKTMAPDRIVQDGTFAMTVAGKAWTTNSPPAWRMVIVGVLAMAAWGSGTRVTGPKTRIGVGMPAAACTGEGIRIEVPNTRAMVGTELGAIAGSQVRTIANVVSKSSL
jgi:hypothetical protein